MNDDTDELGVGVPPESVTLDHHVSIDRSGTETVVTVEDQTFELTDEQVDDVVDDLDGETIWWLISDTVKSLRVLRAHTNDTENWNRVWNRDD